MSKLYIVILQSFYFASFSISFATMNSKHGTKTVKTVDVDLQQRLKMRGTHNSIGFSMGVVAKYYLCGVYTYRIQRYSHNALTVSQLYKRYSKPSVGFYRSLFSFGFHCFALFSHKQETKETS